MLCTSLLCLRILTICAPETERAPRRRSKATCSTLVEATCAPLVEATGATGRNNRSHVAVAPARALLARPAAAPAQLPRTTVRPVVEATTGARAALEHRRRRTLADEPLRHILTMPADALVAAFAPARPSAERRRHRRCARRITCGSVLGDCGGGAAQTQQQTLSRGGGGQY